MIGDRTDLSWSKWDKLGAFCFALVPLVAVFWWAVPTSAVIKPVSFNINGRTATFVRETPRGAWLANWYSEITLIDAQGTECNSGDWQLANYQPKPGNKTTYPMGQWAEPCLSAGVPFYITTTRRALLFGIVPLRAHVTVVDFPEGI